MLRMPKNYLTRECVHSDKKLSNLMKLVMSLAFRKLRTLFPFQRKEFREQCLVTKLESTIKDKRE